LRSMLTTIRSVADGSPSWYSIAEIVRMSWPAELRRHVAARRHAHGCLGTAGPVVLRIKVEPPREERWREAARAAEHDLADWVAAAADEAAHAALPRHTSYVA
jgi:hypothetical protein